MFGRIFKDRIADYNDMKVALIKLTSIPHNSWGSTIQLTTQIRVAPNLLIACKRLLLNQTIMIPKLKLLTGLQRLLSLQPFYNLLRCVS